MKKRHKAYTHDIYTTYKYHRCVCELAVELMMRTSTVWKEIVGHALWTLTQICDRRDRRWNRAYCIAYISIYASSVSYVDFLLSFVYIWCGKHVVHVVRIPHTKRKKTRIMKKARAAHERVSSPQLKRFFAPYHAAQQQLIQFNRNLDLTVKMVYARVIAIYQRYRASEREPSMRNGLIVAVGIG